MLKEMERARPNAELLRDLLSRTKGHHQKMLETLKLQDFLRECPYFKLPSLVNHSFTDSVFIVLPKNSYTYLLARGFVSTLHLLKEVTNQNEENLRSNKRWRIVRETVFAEVGKVQIAKDIPVPTPQNLPRRHRKYHPYKGSCRKDNRTESKTEKEQTYQASARTMTLLP